MPMSFDKRVRSLIGEHDKEMADRIGDMLIEIHAAALSEASNWPEGRERSEWFVFARKLKDLANASIDLPAPQW